MDKKRIRYVFQIVAAAVTVLVTVAVITGLYKGILSSEQAFIDFIKSAGVFAPIVFVIIETVSVVILILPCALGYPVSALAFGPFWGFILNAVSTILGSILIFLIVRLWGKPLVEAAVKKRQIEKYEKFMNRTSFFEKLLAGVLLLPFLPDNVLCYIAGLTKMDFKRYCAIIILFKPWKILFYTYGSEFFINKFSHLWGVTMEIADKIIM